MSENRIYKITEKVGETVSTRLVEAPNAAQAIRHVVSGSITCEVCRVGDAIALGAIGTKVEVATKEAA